MSTAPMTPRGFRDTAPREAAEREALLASVGRALSAWGYDPVETPVVERWDVLAAGAGAAIERDAFRLTDLDGTLLAMRPEMTLPVARMAASSLAGEPRPLRLRYAAPVLREHASLRGEARQFTQVGVELVGAAGPAADAEVVAVMAEALAASGLPEYAIGIGTVAVLNGIIAAAGGSAGEAWAGEVLDAAHRRNLVALDRLAGAAGLPPAAAAALRAVPRVRGGREALAQARPYAAACACEGAVDALGEAVGLLEAAGVADRVIVDFGIMRSFDYYTGLVIEAYAPGLGLPVGGGGRYDGMMAAFGAPAPAAGFALGLERLQIALAEQGVAVPVPPAPAGVGGADPAAAFAEAARRRAAGERVALDLADGDAS